MASSTDKILWVDCLGGLFVGCFVLACYRSLALWENLPTSIVIGMGAANLLYGSYSLFVTTKNPRPVKLVQTLAIANMSWLIFCIGVVAIHWSDISPLGLLHVIGEGVYVCGLGIAEWRVRHDLSSAQPSANG